MLHEIRLSHSVLLSLFYVLYEILEGRDVSQISPILGINTGICVKDRYILDPKKDSRTTKKPYFIMTLRVFGSFIKNN